MSDSVIQQCQESGFSASMPLMLVMAALERGELLTALFFRKHVHDSGANSSKSAHGIREFHTKPSHTYLQRPIRALRRLCVRLNMSQSLGWL